MKKWIAQPHGVLAQEVLLPPLGRRHPEGMTW